jgi:hypothetical protein
LKHIKDKTFTGLPKSSKKWLEIDRVEIDFGGSIQKKKTFIS